METYKTESRLIVKKILETKENGDTQYIKLSVTAHKTDAYRKARIVLSINTVEGMKRDGYTMENYMPIDAYVATICNMPRYNVKTVTKVFALVEAQATRLVSMYEASNIIELNGIITGIKIDIA
jgi:hypothetical protein